MMKKGLLSVLCVLSPSLLSAAAYSAQPAPQSQMVQIHALASQCADPQSKETVDKIVGAFSDAAFTQEFSSACKVHGKEKVKLIAQALSKALSAQERTELLTVFKELRNWCAEYPSVEVLQTPAGQQLEIQHQMQLLSMIQHPLVAALTKYGIELWVHATHDPKVIESVGKLIGGCMQDAYECLEAELGQ